MNSTARAWLSIRRTEEHRLHDGTAAQVERLQALIGGTSQFDVVNRRSLFSAPCRPASFDGTTRVAGTNVAAAQVISALSELCDEERRRREFLSQEETDVRITMLCSMLHCALRARDEGEADRGSCSMAGRGGSVSSTAPRLCVPTPFSTGSLRR
ncbi:hypothetical protein JIQ42_05193 [Leishmania sp. Namibia]|uniref:hypothetical protein n=1 Tax=Leishmania sp. Namibia TaxID=2802991 RepID=UPI001B52BD31|nr:hypothetical protein JIQ42_05193 [Leishmania sp. Namibia]